LKNKATTNQKHTIDSQKKKKKKEDNSSIIQKKIIKTQKGKRRNIKSIGKQGDSYKWQ